MRKRTLYDCLHARVKGKTIYCKQGRLLGNPGTVEVERLARGERLAMMACQNCANFEEMGDPLIRRDKGWIKPDILPGEAVSNG